MKPVILNVNPSGMMKMRIACRIDSLGNKASSYTSTVSKTTRQHQVIILKVAESRRLPIILANLHVDEKTALRMAFEDECDYYFSLNKYQRVGYRERNIKRLNITQSELNWPTNTLCKLNLHM